MSEYSDSIQLTYDHIWKDIRVCGGCPSSMMPLNVRMTKYGEIYEHLVSVRIP